MNNPYDILKISSDASKTEIDAAYYRLMEEYKSEKNGDNITDDISEYKINELKTAYNQIINQLKSNSTVMGQVSSNTVNPYYTAASSSAQNTVDSPNNPDKAEVIQKTAYSQTSDYSSDSYSSSQNSDNYENNDVFGSIKQFIDLGRYTEAENLLNSINYKDTATWHFLYGKMCFGRGWMNQAAVHFERASALAPNNQEYRQEMVKINQMKLDRSSRIPVAPIVAGMAFMGLASCAYGTLVSLPLLVDLFENMC
ncbi:DnaJ domain-containing protein [Porcipelethomonas sp.]|uniref:DnaJ domain-containing protein n=1 Tax=Porcipelethomonas sp. TaxID=2981675 RepID=UPI003EFAB750